MENIGRQQILSLYKNLILYSKTLQFTDKKYYLKRIRTEFQNNKNLQDIKEIEFHYQKGCIFLQNKRLI